MRCPSCNHNGSRVLDSRPSHESRSIRRRRECESCNFRFTTFETIEAISLIVVKKDGTRQEFSREKILRGLRRACEKRPVSFEQLEELVDEVERDLRNRGTSEIQSEDVGELVLANLACIDDVAYVRFASVYRQFTDVNMFIQELKEMMRKK